MQRLANLRWLVLLFASGCLLAQPLLAHCCAAMGSGLADAVAAEPDCPTHMPAASDQAARSAETVPPRSTPHCDGVDALECGAFMAASPGAAPQRIEAVAVTGDLGVDLVPAESAAQGPGSGALSHRGLALSPAAPSAARQRLLLTQRWRL